MDARQMALSHGTEQDGQAAMAPRIAGTTFAVWQGLWGLRGASIKHGILLKGEPAVIATQAYLSELVGLHGSGLRQIRTHLARLRKAGIIRQGKPAIDDVLADEIDELVAAGTIKRGIGGRWHDVYWVLVAPKDVAKVRLHTDDRQRDKPAATVRRGRRSKRAKPRSDQRTLFEAGSAGQDRQEIAGQDRQEIAGQDRQEIAGGGVSAPLEAELELEQQQEASADPADGDAQALEVHAPERSVDSAVVDEAERALAGAKVNSPLRRRLARECPLRARTIGRYYGRNQSITGGLPVLAMRRPVAHEFRPVEMVVDGKLVIVEWLPPARDSPQRDGDLFDGLRAFMADHDPDERHPDDAR